MAVGNMAVLFDLAGAQPFNPLPYLFLGLFAMLEGPAAILVGGAAASSGLLLPLPVYLAVVVGNLSADMGWYGLGRCGRLDWLERLGPKAGIDPRRIQQLEQGIRKNAPRLLFLSKLTVGFPIPTLVATGLSRVPVRRWLGMLVLGELLKSAALVLVGYLLARAVLQASAAVQGILWGVTAVVGAAVLVWVRRRKKYPPPAGDAWFRVGQPQPEGPA